MSAGYLVSTGDGLNRTWVKQSGWEGGEPQKRLRPDGDSSFRSPAKTFLGCYWDLFK